MPRRLGLSRDELDALVEVAIAESVRESLARHGTAEEERCGWALGAVCGQRLEVSALRVAANDAADGRAAFALATGSTPVAGGSRVVGVFHTHPEAPPVLSEHDRLSMAVGPFVWCVVGRSPSSRAVVERWYAPSSGGVRDLRAA
jgi:proteasome lid subunit RPN8/RPN11